MKITQTELNVMRTAVNRRLQELQNEMTVLKQFDAKLSDEFDNQDKAKKVDIGKALSEGIE